MGVKITFDDGEYLKGLNEVVEKIQNEVDKLQVKSTQGLADALLFVATESQQRAPVEFGDLRGSVLVEIDDVKIAKGTKSELTEDEKRKIRKEGNYNDTSGIGLEITSEGVLEKATKGTVSYNTKYAAVQHEQINYNHPRGGQAKYLESVLIENKDRILNIIADKMRGEE